MKSFLVWLESMELADFGRQSSIQRQNQISPKKGRGSSNQLPRGMNLVPKSSIFKYPSVLKIVNSPTYPGSESKFRIEEDHPSIEISVVQYKREFGYAFNKDDIEELKLLVSRSFGYDDNFLEEYADEISKLILKIPLKTMENFLKDDNFCIYFDFDDRLKLLIDKILANVRILERDMKKSGFYLLGDERRKHGVRICFSKPVKDLEWRPNEVTPEDYYA